MPATPALQTASQEGLLVFTGAFGSAWRDGVKLTDVIEASGAVEIARIDLPLVGQTRLGHKPGRETREGTLRIQKRDTSWEMEVFGFLTSSIDERRKARDAGKPLQRPFSLILEYDDPYTLGRERCQLDGVLLWRLPLGFSIADDGVEREYPMTWETERYLEAYKKEIGTGGVARPSWYIGPTP